MPIASIIAANEFREIMENFTNPLEVIRESIQNSIDANAKTFPLKSNIFCPASLSKLARHKAFLRFDASHDRKNPAP